MSERVRILRKIPVVKPEVDQFLMESKRYIQFPLLLIYIYLRRTENIGIWKRTEKDPLRKKEDKEL